MFAVRKVHVGYAMRFLCRLENQRKFKPGDARALASTSYEAVRKYGADVGNLRVGSKAVELDLLLASRDSLQASTDALEEKLGPLLTVRELDMKTPEMDVDRAIREGVELFNEERYWESHEALESAWRQTLGSEKEVLQGMILVAAALVHLQKGEGEVALSVMGRAEDKLRRHRGERLGVDLDDLIENLSRMIAARKPGFFKVRARRYSSRAAA
jgi:hypothetical protein